ncbi:MAG TPA: fibronectin type III domain-containing protein, partial [Candidatus Limnocylindrales bacterium]|nr:fibronectin type III domain-containing protein [Candidatus Limnocylindrales bacterium]
MLDLASNTEAKFTASLKPWINIMVDLAARFWIGAALVGGFTAPTAMAQVHTPFATGVTEPMGGLVLSGSAVNPQTGRAYRHLWNSDQGGFGLCRLDPDVDTPGPHTVNINTCLPFVAGVAFKPGQLAFDPGLNNIYAVDVQSNTQGVYRLHYVPTADGGHGALDMIHQEVLGGNGLTGRNGTPGCVVPGNTPNSAALGPDGNLYIGFKRSGNIVRLNSPQTDPFPCSNVQIIGTTPDQTKNFGLAWIGHDLYGGDGISLWVIANGDQCLTPQNGQFTCRGHNIFQSQTALPTFVMSDQIYPDTGGTNIYVATPSSITLVNMVTTLVTPNYATGFEFLSGLAIDSTDSSIFAADDPTAGKLPSQGRWFDLGNGPSNGGRPVGTLTEFASGVTEPIGGVVLTGTAVNPATGQPYRHFWTSDLGGFGLCRLDPDMDTPGVHTMNVNTCMAFVAGVQFKPGELAFDPILNNLYAVDLQANTQGIFRLHYLPSGDGGHGAFDPLHAEVLGGSATTVHQQLPGCGIPGNVPNSAVLGPDGNLYVGFKASGDIIRIVSPQTEPLPCSNIQTIGTTPDGRKDFGLGFIGHDLFGGDGLSAWIMVAADMCVKPATGNQRCQSNSILVPQTASPTYVMTDQLYPSMNGRNLFVGKPGSITLVDTTTLKVAMDYATGFQFLTGMALDPTNLSLFAADDATGGKVTGQGHWWLVGGQQQSGPAAPGTPANVIATAGDGQVSLAWTPAADGQAVTSFIVENSFASNGSTVPPSFITPPAGSVVVPASTVITGLTNGVSYEFVVAAANSIGTSAFSTPSNAVMPQAITVPDPPTNVLAQAANASASITWSAPVNNGGSPITGYTVSALIGGSPSGISTATPATATGAALNGLTNGTSYTFIVQASNAIGIGAASVPSNPVTPQPPAPPAVADVLVAISGPNSLPPQSTAGYEITVTNKGNTAIAQLVVVDSYTSGAASAISAIPSQGSCTTGASINCMAGALSPGGTVAVGITHTLVAKVLHTATVQALDAKGNAMAIA